MRQMCSAAPEPRVAATLTHSLCVNTGYLWPSQTLATRGSMAASASFQLLNSSSSNITQAASSPKLILGLFGCLLLIHSIYGFVMAMASNLGKDVYVGRYIMKVFAGLCDCPRKRIDLPLT